MCIRASFQYKLANSLSLSQVTKGANASVLAIILVLSEILVINRNNLAIKFFFNENRLVCFMVERYSSGSVGLIMLAV